MPKLFSYVVVKDRGFAPNPFHEYCTLATCKGLIRERANVGDWILGTGSAEKHRRGYFVYAMKVTEKLTFNDYWADRRFQSKKPDMRSSLKRTVGDNVYRFDGDRWWQADSVHSHSHGGQNSVTRDKDTKSDNVLISDRYMYFGGDGFILPDELLEKGICAGRNYKSNFSEETVQEFITWVESLPDWGYCGDPLDWS